jgi:hypothetical protein
MAGENGTILKTLNGGINWNIETISTTQGIRKIQTLKNIAYCWVGGGDIYISGYANSVGESQTKKDLISIYPNPASTVINVQFKDNSLIRSVQIFNTLGQCEFLQEVKGNNLQVKIDVSNLSKGIKTIVIKGKENYVSKIVIE